MIHYVGGLPRSLSTVLTCILAQNPRFSVTGTSPMIHLVTAARKARTGMDFKALSKADLDERFPHVLRGIMEGWFASDSSSVNFDKCRGWLGHIDLIEKLYESPKLIVPIRDVRACVSSMEKLWRKSPDVWTELVQPGTNQGTTIQSRVDAYLAGAPLGIALERLFEAHQRGQIERALIVKAESLSRNPESTMKMLHSYIEEPFYDYDFTIITQAILDNDVVHEPFGEHTVRPSIEPLVDDWDEILTPGVSADIKERCAWFYEAFYPNAV